MLIGASLCECSKCLFLDIVFMLDSDLQFFFFFFLRNKTQTLINCPHREREIQILLSEISGYSPGRGKKLSSLLDD